MQPVPPTDAETLIDACEAVRHRLPAAHFPQASRLLDDLEPVLADYDAFLLDAFGVLNVGERAIPGAAACVAALRAAGKSVMVVSNAASVPKAVLADKYRRLGFPFAAADIASSRDALLAALRAEAPRRWAVMAPPAADLSDLPGIPARLLDDPVTYAHAEGFILLAAAGWTEDRQRLLAEALVREPRPVLVANPDLVAPRESGLSLEPGHYARRLEAATQQPARYFGKPFANLFDLALQRLPQDVPRERILMVGDTLHTDILGGAAAGLHTALVVDHGVSRGLDLSAAIARTGIRPHFIARRI